MYYLCVDEFRNQADPASLTRIIPSHAAWVEKMISQGRILQAGKWGNLGGMAIFRAESAAQVEDWLAGAPLVASGLIDWQLAEFWPMVALD